MNMLQFDRGVWGLHRRLHHRFLKFFQHVEDATADLEDYQARAQTDATVERVAKSATNAVGDMANVMCLLSSSSSSEAEASASDVTDDE